MLKDIDTRKVKKTNLEKTQRIKGDSNESNSTVSSEYLKERDSFVDGE